MYKRKLNAIDDYERQVCLLREEVTYLSSEKAMLQQRCAPAGALGVVPAEF